MVLKIKITKHKSNIPSPPSQADRFRADPADMPGTPPNGEGNSIAEAIGSLILRMNTEWNTWNRYGWPIFEIEEGV